MSTCNKWKFALEASAEIVEVLLCARKKKKKMALGKTGKQSKYCMGNCDSSEKKLVFCLDFSH